MIRPVHQVVASEVFIMVTPQGWISGKNKNGDHLVISPQEYITSAENTFNAMILVLAGEGYDLLRVEYYLPSTELGKTIRDSIKFGLLSCIKGHFSNGDSFVANLNRPEDYKKSLLDAVIELEPSHEQYLPKSIAEINTESPFVFSTDASKNHNNTTASWSFIVDQFTYDTLINPDEKKVYGDYYFQSGLVECQQVSEAESYAILKTYCWLKSRTNDSFQKMIIRCDSQEAIQNARRGLKAGFPKMEGKLFLQIQLLQKDIENGRVVIQKVKAHRDDKQNNQADRIALATRRAHRAGFSKTKMRKHIKQALQNLDQELATVS